VRVLGWDCGAWLAWCLLDCARSRPVYMSSGTIEVGAQRERRKGTKIRMIREVDDEAIDRMRLAVVAVLREQAPDLVAVERVQDVHPTGRHEARTGQATGTAIATGLVLASGVAWALFCLTRERSIPCVTYEEADWRKALGCAPAPKGMSEDAWIGRVIPGRIDGWPGPRTTGITSHVRDAAGVAEYAAIKVRGGGRW